MRGQKIFIIFSVLIANVLVCKALAQVIPPENFKIAFIGNQGHGGNCEAVLDLISSEHADAVVHSGGFDGTGNPETWDQLISEKLGSCFPYFAVVGDEEWNSFYGGSGYQEKLMDRMNCLGIPWQGDLGVKSSHMYQGIFFVFTSPDIFGDGEKEYAPFIRDQLEQDQSIWRISSWHLLMRKMQIGSQFDQTGWGVYEESRQGGAIIATAQANSYGRTHPLSNLVTQEIASQEDMFEISRDDLTTNEDEGVTFVFHNGLGGDSISSQNRCLPTAPPFGCQGEWASIYSEDQNANYGALFGQFHYEGDPCLARFYFKDIDGNIVDEFFVESTLDFCEEVFPCPGDVNGDQEVNQVDLELLLEAWGQCQGQCEADVDENGVVSVVDLLMLLANWGSCS